MGQVQVQYIESLFQLSHEVSRIANDLQSSASRIASNTYEMRSLAMSLVSRVQAGRDSCERALYDAEQEYDSYMSRPEEERDRSVEAELKAAVRAAAEALREAEADLNEIRSLEASMESYCSALYSVLTGRSSSIYSRMETLSYKIDEEGTVLQQYAE